MSIVKNRIYGLDILRALSIIIVMIEHGKYYLPKNLNTVLKSIFIDGVTVFFILSGFLIGGILIRMIQHEDLTEKTLFDFWKKRWLRTLPNYFLVLIILCLISSSHYGFRFSDTWNYFIFMQNLFTPHPDFFQEAWSLSVEECFYLITPLLIYILVKYSKLSKPQAFIYGVIVMIVSASFFRFYRYANIELTHDIEWNAMFRRQVFTRLDSLAYGLLGAFYQNYCYKNWVKYNKQLFFIGISALIISKIMFNTSSPIGMYNAVFSFTIDSVSILLLFPFLSEIKKGQGLIYRMITKTSLISYSMYLLNLSIVQHSIINNIHWELIFTNPYLVGLTKYSLFWILTFILSTWLYKYFEIPIMNLRDLKISLAK